MAAAHKYFYLSLVTIFFILVFILGIRPLVDFDIWFHLKSGEIISQLGIIHYDLFSYNTTGREWFPYEWLFQLTIYHFQQIFGFEAIKYLIAGFITVQLLIFYALFRKIFKLHQILSLSCCFFFLVSIYEFLSARPHIFAYTFLIANLSLILLYYFKGKNFLWITLPITLAWANLHGSIFLDIALFLGYATICFAESVLFKDKAALKRVRTLGLFALGTFILTILPPLGFTQYRLLGIFFGHRQLISNFIDEWVPLYINPIGFIVFSVTVLIVLSWSIFLVFKFRKYRESLWLLPLLPFILVAYIASRNIFLGYISLTLILAWNLSQLHIKSYPKLVKITLWSLFLVFLGIHIYILQYKYTPQTFYYPVEATKFIKEQNFQGNMFNEYGYGGYMLYHLYPNQKVFFDGRTDLYLCCEMPDTLDLAMKKNLPDPEFKKVLDNIWNKYHISYVIMRTEKHILLRRISRILEADPAWGLVYWDDRSQIFVRLDNQNDRILENFGVKAATPYNKNPFRENMEDRAMEEYQRMIKFSDSARSRNAIGFILLKKGQLDEATQEFSKATFLDPAFESPYMNMAEIVLTQGDLDKAIKLYRIAQKNAPDRGLIYIRLGQLTLEKTGDPIQAKKIWVTGFNQTVDEDAKAQIKKLIEQYQ